MKHNEKLENLKEWEDTAKNKEFTYPMWFKHKNWGYVVEFTDLRHGIVVVDGTSSRINKDFSCSIWTAHTDSETWEQVENPNKELDKHRDDLISEIEEYENQKPIQYQIGIDTIANEVFYSDGKLFWKEFKNGRRKNLLAGNVRKDGYLTICINKKSFLQHRVVWYIFNGPIPDGYEIDHIDRNPRNNKIDNLRLVSSQENKFNSYAKGYTWNKDKNKWTAAIWLNKKRIHLGHFNNEEDARKAYIDAKNKLHGDLNYEY